MWLFLCRVDRLVCFIYVVEVEAAYHYRKLEGVELPSGTDSARHSLPHALKAQCLGPMRQHSFRGVADGHDVTSRALSIHSQVPLRVGPSVVFSQQDAAATAVLVS